MKLKVPIIILALACLGLIVWLILLSRAAERQKQKDVETISYLSNQWTETSTRLDAQTATNLNLTANLQTKILDLEKTTAELGDTRSNLSRVETEVKMTQEQLDAAKAEVAKRNARISELENQNVALDKQAGDMKSAIADLETKITEIERKLARSEGDREFLLKELKRMQAEKAELERKFNDLVVLREQVKKLKEELAIQRRLEWIRRGLYGTPRRGAEVMQGGFSGPAMPGNTNVGLNVELRREGPARILTPTNAPPASAPNR